MQRTNQAAVLPLHEEKRRFQRVRVNILGRYMLPNRREYPCQVVDMSPGGAKLIVPVPGTPGDRIVAYLDHLGRIEGRLVRIFETGFAMTVDATARKRDKLAAQLTWLANRHELGLPEDRRHDRLALNNAATEVTLPDGRSYRCKIIDMSMSGAALASEVVPAIGTPVTLGRTSGSVVRHFPDGYAVEFSTPQTLDSLSEQFGDVD